MKHTYIFFCLFSLSLQASTVIQNDQKYSIIQALLNQYERPFSTLEIGATHGDYSLRIAQDYSAVCVMIEESSQLLEICKAHSHLGNLILLNKVFTPVQLQHLSECEDFDVVLARNIKHIFGNEWQEAVDALFNMGHHIVIEILPQQKDLENYILTKGARLLGKVFDSATSTFSMIYLFEATVKFLQRKTWLRSCIQESLYRIESSFTNKTLSKPLEWSKRVFQLQQWIPGINLCTFKMCHGIYPTKEMLKKQLNEIPNCRHTDWMANNMIVRGNSLALIDGDDVGSKCFYSYALLQAHKDFIDLDVPAKIEHYFWHTLVKTSVPSRQVLKWFSELFPPCPVIFDIGSCSDSLIGRYLGYGAKVVCCDPHTEIINTLHEKYKQEAIFITDSILIQQKTGAKDTLDGMVALYGVPDFCNIHCKGGSVYATLKTLSSRISCISYKFDIRYPEDLALCLSHLTSLGYTKFNFSVRDIFGFVLQPCKYTGSKKQWVHTTSDLLQEIAAFAVLDYQGEKLWGYIYARSDNDLPLA